MAGLRDEYLMRQVRAVAAMLARLIGLRVEGNVEQAGAELEQAFGLLLGDQAGLIRRIDSATAAVLLQSTVKIMLYARLLKEEALQRGAAPVRAAELVIEVLRRVPDDAEARALLEELKSSLSAEQLPPEYRSDFA